VPAGLVRRFGAMIYDVLLIVALSMVFTASLLPFSKGEAITPETFGAMAYLYRVALVAIWAAFYGVFWTRQGQTLGMMAWRIKLERQGGGWVSWRIALTRLVAAAALPVVIAMLGLALPALARPIMIVALAVWLASYGATYVDRERRALHDRWSHTRVIKTLTRADARPLPHGER
jgi:uncharacterized RDD family membrane protein YckC